MAGISILSKPFSRFNRIWDRALDLIKKTMDAPTVPYVAGYRVDPQFLLPEDFDVSDYKGLALCHVTADAGDHKMLTYWTSKEHFSAHSRMLEQALPALQLEVFGFLSDLRSPKQRWWEHFSFKDWIISTAGVVSAITLLGGIVTGWLEAPQAKVVFTDTGPLRAISNTGFTFVVNVVNDDAHDKLTVSDIAGIANAAGVNQPVGTHEIEARALAADGITTFPLSPDQGNLAPLAVDESKKVTFSATAPPSKEEDGAPDIYQIVVGVQGKAGRFREKQDFHPAAARTLEVWPSQIGCGAAVIDQGGAVNGARADAAQVHVYLYPGRSFASVSGTILVTSAPGEISEIISEDKVKGPFSSPPGNSVTLEIGFRIKSLEKFVPYKLVFYLQASKPLSEARWKQIVGSVKIHAGSE